MPSKLTKLFAAAAILGGLATATTVFADEAAPPSQPPQTEAPMGGGGMMNMKGQMNPDQMKQMSRMVDNCNRMMESMGTAPPTPKPAPATRG